MKKTVICFLFIIFTTQLMGQDIFKNYPNTDDLYGAYPTDQNYYTTEDSNLTLIGRWAYGDCTNIFIVNNYAYINSGPVLEILDITDPINPIRLGRVMTPEFIEDIYVKNNYAYIADYNSGMRIIDISHPNLPQEVGFIDTPGRAKGIFALANYAYVADEDSGLRIIDVSNPQAPVQVNSIVTGGIAENVFVLGDFAYMVDFIGLRIFDVSNPISPLEIGFLQTPGASRSIFVKDSLAFIADWYGGFRIINVSNPELPFEMGSFNNNIDEAIDVFVDGHYAYLTFSGDSPPVTGLRIFDVSNPWNPVNIGSASVSGWAESVYVSNKMAFVTRGQIYIYDVSIPANPNLKNIYYPYGDMSGITVDEQFAYIADKRYGLVILDVSDPNNPQEIHSFQLAGIARDIVLVNNYAYMAYSGLRVIDISNPFSPVEVSYYPTTGNPSSIFIKDSLAYLADGNNGLRILNVKNPSYPFEIGSFPTSGSAVDISIAGNYAYLVNSPAGIHIIDISNPENPTEVYFISSADKAEGIFILFPYAYIADGFGGLRIFDISSPSNPQEIGSVNIIAFKVYVNGDYAYVKSHGQVKLIDIRNPYTPLIVGFASVPSEKISVKNNLVYVAGQRWGLFILRNDLITQLNLERNFPSSFKLFQNFPNPFNERTTIYYQLPINTYVRLYVYNTKGQLVTKLVDGFQYEGSHSVLFDASNLSSGVYFYKFEGRGYKTVKKALLIK